MKFITKILFDPIIYGALCFLLGVLITSIINHFLVKSRDEESLKIKEFNSSAEKFRNVFRVELVGLYPTPKDWHKWKIRELLDSRFSKFDWAVDEFKDFLPEERQRDFISAWETFHMDTYYPCSGRSTDKDGKVTEHSYTEEQCKKNFKNNVKRMLDFAKHK